MKISLYYKNKGENSIGFQRRLVWCAVDLCMNQIFGMQLAECKKSSVLDSDSVALCAHRASGKKGNGYRKREGNLLIFNKREVGRNLVSVCYISSYPRKSCEHVLLSLAPKPWSYIKTDGTGTSGRSVRGTNIKA